MSGEDLPDTDSDVTSPIREMEFKRIFEMVEDAVFIFDVIQDGSDYEFVFRQNNPAHEKLTGLESNEYRGENPREIPGDELGQQVEKRYRYPLPTICLLSRPPGFDAPSGSYEKTPSSTMISIHQKSQSLSKNTRTQCGSIFVTSDRESQNSKSSS